MNMAKPFGYVRKRKESSSEMGKKIKKQKVDNEPKVVKTELDTYLPRKSKKNKYFLLAHPEIIKDKEESKNSSDVIDINKLKKMKAKSEKQTSSENKNKKGESKSTKKSLKTKSNNAAWVFISKIKFAIFHATITTNTFTSKSREEIWIGCS